MKRINSLLLSTSLLLIFGCATQGVDRHDQNVMIKTFVAKVNHIKQVELSSHVKTGMIIGATDGALTSIVEDDGDHFLGSMVIGAAVGGLFTKLFEGSNEAYEYNLYTPEQGNFSVIQKEQLAADVECVEVRMAGETTVKAVSNEQCNAISQQG